MKNFCDYDAIVHYPSGTFGAKYKTDLTGKLEEITKDDNLSEDEINSFRDRQYKTYRVLEPVVLYRLFGMYQSSKVLEEGEKTKGARLTGRFLSTEFAESIIDAKIRLALKPSWFNTKMFEAKVLVPPGVVLSMGIVASVELPTGTVLAGGAEQLLLPYDWNKDWIQGYRRVTARQLQYQPQYWHNPPFEVAITKKNLYPEVCPVCAYDKIVVLPEEEQFTITGIKGNRYTMKRRCLNTECSYYW